MSTSTTTLEAIHGRHSIRDGFTNEPIGDSILNTIIQAGLVAPSSKGAQPWVLHVVHQGQMLSEIGDAIQNAKSAATNAPIDPTTGELRQWPSTVTTSARVIKEANVGIFIENSGPFSGSRDVAINAPRENRENAIIGHTFEIIGIGAMMMSMWLAARAKGLEGVFMGDVMAAEDAIKSKLGMTGDLIGVLALGYVNEPPFAKNRALKSNSVVTHNQTEAIL